MSGLFSAAFLRRLGWEVDVYERSGVELVGRGAGITTHPELLEALEKCGAGMRDLGVYGDFGQSLYQQSAVAGGGPILSATWSSFDAGLRWRMRFAERRHITPSVGVAFAYGRTAFTFDDGGQLLGGTPSADYRYLRPALDARVAFGPVIVRADAGYRAVLSAGYVGSHFPRADIGGVDVSVGLTVKLPKRLELGLSGQYQRYFYDMNSQPGDPFVAGGALDEFVTGELALAYVF